MAKYSIDSSTLTALGNAVRVKIDRLENGEIPYLNTEFKITDYMGGEGVQWYRFTLPNTKKMKVILTPLGDGYHDGEWPANTSAKLGIKYNPPTTGWLDDDFILPYDTVFPYEFINDYNAIGFKWAGPSRYRPIEFNVELIALDDEGNNYNYTPAEMVNKINTLQLQDIVVKQNGTYTPDTGYYGIGSVKVNTASIPDSALIITGNCSSRFANSGWDWFISDNLITSNITNASQMFYNSQVKEIPFELNLTNNTAFNDIFYNMTQLEYAPQLNTTFTSHRDFGGLFSYCYNLKEVPDWLGDLLEMDYNISATNTVFQPWGDMFNSCYSLRSIPEKVMKYIANPNMSNYYYGITYSKPFSGCRSLDELVNIHCDNYNLTSNQFNYFFEYLSRVKNITFATNDGAPVIRPWKSQTLDMTKYVGYVDYNTNILNYNSGITADKQVYNDATYQALKNDPDWFSADANYSRYNHDSAVNTINSLPDCSATGTNTIKFKGTAGSLTDGGAINTLTDEEIAIASAKGWTVSFT